MKSSSRGRFGRRGRSAEQTVAPKPRPSANNRLYVWYGVLVLIGLAFITRLFYLQVIQHDYYHAKALNDQLKQYTIAAPRGIIEAQQAGKPTPLVLNQTLYTLFGDPTLVKNASADASKLAAITGASADDYQKLLQSKNTRYAVLAKRLSHDQSDKIEALKLPGVGTQAQEYRTYPQGDLASQLIGFVNGEGKGTYGIEQVYDSKLAGTPGKLKAITDVSGVPLAASRDNIQIDPSPGANVILTIDLAMQKQVETILKAGLDAAHSTSGSAIVLDPNSGEIKAMANFPTFDPDKYYQQTDPSVFANAAVDKQFEVGSVMKTLTVSAGLDKGVIKADSTYNDPGTVTVDGSTIHDVLDPPNPTSIQDILTLSLNTGAVHILSLMGGGEINQQARTTWNDYLVNRFQLGNPTGIEQTGEASGNIPDPLHGYSLNLQYAETAFGQGMSATLLQMTSAVAATFNGGTYYKPHLVSQVVSPSGASQATKPQVVKSGVISPQASQDIRQLLVNDFNTNHIAYKSNIHDGYNIGGKTGTAQIAENGSYLESLFNGDFIGFVGGDKPQYVVAVLVNKPDIPSYATAGAKAAAPIFGAISDMLINSSRVTPIGN